MNQITKGFIIRQPWADLILSGKKTWEIRGSRCNIRGWVGLVCQGQWVGNVKISDSLELSLSQYQQNQGKHQVPDTTSCRYKNINAWVITDFKKFKTPKKYTHKPGCVIWVNLP